MAGPTPIAFTADPDIAGQQMAAQRQQALAAMLMEGANQPLATNQMAGRYVVPVSPFQALAKLGQASLAGYGMKQADAKQMELAKLLQEKQQQAMQTFPQARSMEQAGPTPEGGNIPPVTINPTPDQYIRWAQQNPTSPMAAEVLKGAMGAQFEGMKPYSLRPNEKRFDGQGNVTASNPGPVTVTRTEQLVNPTTGKPDTLLFRSDGSQAWLGAMPYERPGEFRQLLETIPDPQLRQRIAYGYLAEKGGLPTERSVAEQTFRATQRHEGQGPLGPYMYQTGGQIPTPFGAPTDGMAPSPQQPSQTPPQAAPGAGAPVMPPQRGAAPAPSYQGGGGFGAPTAAGQPNKVQVEARNSANNQFITKRLPEIEQEGSNAVTSNAELQALRPMFAQTGWAAPVKGWAAQVLSGVGLGGEAASALASDKEKFASFVLTNNWRLLGEQKGPQTEGDAQRAMATYVQYKNRPESNEFIADWITALNNRKIERLQWIQQNYDRFEAQGNVGGLERAWRMSPEGKRSIWDDPGLQKWRGGQSPKQGGPQLPVPANSKAGGGGLPPGWSVQVR